MTNEEKETRAVQFKINNILQNALEMKDPGLYGHQTCPNNEFMCKMHTVSYWRYTQAGKGNME